MEALEQELARSSDESWREKIEEIAITCLTRYPNLARYLTYSAEKALEALAVTEPVMKDDVNGQAKQDEQEGIGSLSFWNSYLV